MLITMPIWVLTLMLSLIALFSISTYYLIGFIVFVFLSIAEREIDYLEISCYEIMSNNELTCFEKMFINKFIDITSSIKEDRIFKLSSSWPIVIITMRRVDAIVDELGRKTVKV